MNLTENALIRYCHSLPGAQEDVKWGNDLVFSVFDKMFCVFILPECADVSVKVPKEQFLALTAQPDITPAPYLARHGWVTIANLDNFKEQTLQNYILTSYELVVAKLPRSKQKQLSGG